MDKYSDDTNQGIARGSVFRREEEVEHPILNGAIITVQHWGEERKIVYQSGIKHGLVAMLHELASLVEPDRQLEISEVDYDDTEG